MFSVVIALIIAAGIGYTAQVTGLCMVRGVSDWIGGLRLTAILMAGFWIYLFTPLIDYPDHPFLAVYPFHWSIPLGGFVFGLGAAINGALFLYEPAWSPSDFVRDAGLNLMTGTSPPPSLLRAMILLSMLLGMTPGAWRFGHFRWVLPALPALSLASLSALTGMLAGIWLGVWYSARRPHTHNS